MRKTFFLLIVSIAIPAAAQFRGTPAPTPTPSPTPTPAPTPTPSASATPAARPTVLSAERQPAAGNAIDISSFTNLLSTGALSNLIALSNLLSTVPTDDLVLSNLQASLGQTLPLLTSLSAGNTAGIASADSLLRSNAVVNNPAVTNLGAAAGAMGAGMSPTVPGPQTPSLPPTGIANPGAINNLAAPPGSISAGGPLPSNPGTITTDAQTLSQLVGLQNNLQQALPVLQSLNIGSFSGGSNLFSTGATNNVVSGTNTGGLGAPNTALPPTLQQNPAQLPGRPTTSPGQNRTLGNPQGRTGR